MSDFTVTVEGNWARVVHPNGRTALCQVSMSPKQMVFHIVRWFETQEELLAIMAAIAYTGASRSSIMEVLSETQEVTSAREGSPQDH